MPPPLSLLWLLAPLGTPGLLIDSFPTPLWPMDVLPSTRRRKEPATRMTLLSPGGVGVANREALAPGPWTERASNVDDSDRPWRGWSS